MPRTVTTFCRICEALCGLRVTVSDDRRAVLEVRPDPDHLTTAGFACPKGLHQHRIYGGPDRLRAPARRDGEGWTPLSWERALGEVGATLRRIRAESGPDAIGLYLGTAGGFSLLHPVFAQGWISGVGSRSAYSPASQDCAPKFAAAQRLYGHPMLQPFPDVDRARCLIVVGANPAVSKMSFVQLPNPVERLRAVERRGGKLYVVDPRRTETARAAGSWVPIRPDTDVFFYLSFLCEAIAAGGTRGAGGAPHLRGFDELSALARRWPAERTAPVTGISAQTLRQMVRDYLAVEEAALYCSTGVNMGRSGTLCFWLQEAINAACGKLDRAGGTLVGRGLVDFPRLAHRHGVLLSQHRARLSGLPAVNDCLPGGVLADEILTPGPGKLRALVVTGGNPLLTMPNAARLRRALAALDLLVVIDILPTETAAIAHYRLPATSPFERPDLPFAFPLLMGQQAVPYLQATEAVVDPDGEQRSEPEIFCGLCHASGTPIFGSRAAQTLLGGAFALARRLGRAPGGAERALFGALLRATGQPGFGKLLAQYPHGFLRAPHAAGSFLSKRVLTEDRRVDLAPADLLARAEGLEALFAEEQGRTGELRLISRRQVKTHNSWTHAAPELIPNRLPENHLTMHPDDAAVRGLSAGEIVDVRSATATVRLPLSLDENLSPGSVALPHGWGHQVAPELSVAGRTAGVNVNLLPADGPEALDPISGMVQLCGIPVQVSGAAGPRNTRSWSGI